MGAKMLKSTRLTKFAQGKKSDWFYFLTPTTNIFQNRHFAKNLFADITKYKLYLREEELPEEWYEPVGHIWVPV